MRSRQHDNNRLSPRDSKRKPQVYTQYFYIINKSHESPYFLEVKHASMKKKELKEYPVSKFLKVNLHHTRYKQSESLMRRMRSYEQTEMKRRSDLSRNFRHFRTRQLSQLHSGQGREESMRYSEGMERFDVQRSDHSPGCERSSEMK